MEELLQSLPAPMQVNYTALIVAAIFLLVILVLNILVFKPLMAILEDRERRIREGVEARENSLQTVEERQAEYQEKLRLERKKVQANRQNLLKELEMERDTIVLEAREQAMARIQAAATDLDRQVADAKNAMRQETEALARQIVSSVLSRASAA